VEFIIIEKGGSNHLTILNAIFDCISKHFRWNELALDDHIIRILLGMNRSLVPPKYLELDNNDDRNLQTMLMIYAKMYMKAYLGIGYDEDLDTIMDEEIEDRMEMIRNFDKLEDLVKRVPVYEEDADDPKVNECIRIVSSLMEFQPLLKMKLRMDKLNKKKMLYSNESLESLINDKLKILKQENVE
jgi:hypothetical protein